MKWIYIRMPPLEWSGILVHLMILSKGNTDLTGVSLETNFFVGICCDIDIVEDACDNECLLRFDKRF